MTTDGAERLKILIAEDDPNDQKLLALASEREGIGRVFVVSDGDEVIGYLRGDGKFADRVAHPFPDVVIVDLKMPRMSGLEVLDWIRKRSAWPRLPVVLLSGSGLDRDVEEAYRLGANSYFQKPSTVGNLKRLLRMIAEYWALTEKPKRTRRSSLY